jgi:hypothetical protein
MKSLIQFLSIVLSLNLSLSTEIKQKEYFKISSSGNQVSYDLSKNDKNLGYINFQLFYCKEKENKKSHFELVGLKDGKSKQIYETDIITSRQFSIPLNDTNDNNFQLKINGSSIYIYYQYLNEEKKIFPYGIVKKFEGKEKEMEFTIEPIINNTLTQYFLYKINKNTTDICDIIDHSLKEKPIGQKNETGIVNRNFTLRFQGNKNDYSYLFIKGVILGDFTYVHFYDIVKANPSNLGFIIFLIVASIFVIIVIVFIILKKQGIIFSNNDTNIENTTQGLLA